MSPSAPFTTLRELCAKYGIEAVHIIAAADATNVAEQRLKDAFGGNTRLLDADTSLVICGSFARYEMTEDSDYDWSLLVDGVVNTEHARLARDVDEVFQTNELPQPGTSGTFGNTVYSHELVHCIGGSADSNANLTRRMSLILESRPFSLSATDSAVRVWRNVVNNLLKRYFEEDVHFKGSGAHTVPRLLLNDLTRYWRTICVDYAAKYRDQEGKKWAIRNAKLRFSRKLLYASGFAFCLKCQLSRPASAQSALFPSLGEEAAPFIEGAMDFVMKPPLEYLAEFVRQFVVDDAKCRDVVTLVFGSYDKWLELISDKNNRDRLKKLTHDKAKGDELFEQVRTLSSKFAAGLELLLFDHRRDVNGDPVASLALQYVGF